MRRAVAVALAVAVVAAGLAGCSTRLGGRPVAATTLSPQPEEHTAAAMLGDLPTLDPCSLTDPDVFGDFGTAEFAEPESLDYCAISVQPRPGVDVIVTVGRLGTVDATPDLVGKRVRDVADDLYVAQLDDTVGSCAQALVFADEVTLEVTSATYQGDPPDTCDMVTAGMDNVVAVLDGGAGAGHRSPAADSLVGIDPCTLVDDAAVTALPGFEAAQRREYPGHHQCYWETSSGPERLSLRIMFAAGPIPAPYGSGSASSTLAGRPTITSRYPDIGEAAYCSVNSGHIAFDEVPGQDSIVEIAEVYARVPKGKLDQGCQAAVSVATAVWPRLPPP